MRQIFILLWRRRYSEAVNVIGFIYSVFQFVVLAELMRRNKHLIAHPKRDLFDFTMDQVCLCLPRGRLYHLLFLDLFRAVQRLVLSS